jgi:hypothetical protein
MDMYLHVRVVFAMIVGLGVTHLLRGIALIVEHPGKNKAYWVHLVWVFFLFLYLIHFWWWEFRLENVRQWTFPLYFFVAMYAVLLYLLCALLFPEEMSDYDGFESYFYSRRKWIFALLAALFAVDVLDTAIKGTAYLHTLGILYYVRTVAYIALSLVAIKTTNRKFHATFAVLGTAYELVFIFMLYRTLDVSPQ